MSEEMNPSVDGVFERRHQIEQPNPLLRCLFTLSPMSQAAMHQLGQPKDSGIQHILSVTCLPGHLNYQELLQMKSKILFKLEQLEAGTLKGFWSTDDGQNPLINEKLTACSNGWERGGGTTELLLDKTVINDTCHSRLLPRLVSSPPERPLLLSDTFPRVHLVKNVFKRNHNSMFLTSHYNS